MPDTGGEEVARGGRNGNGAGCGVGVAGGRRQREPPEESPFCSFQNLESVALIADSKGEKRADQARGAEPVQEGRGLPGERNAREPKT